ARTLLTSPPIEDESMRLASWRCLIMALGVVFAQTATALSAEPGDSKLAGQLRNLNAKVLPADANQSRMLADNARQRLQAINLRENEAWEKLTGRAGWEQFRDVRLKALRAALGEFPALPRQLKVQTTGTLEGEGYRIEKLVFESRPGLIVAAHLYVPAKP